MQAIHESFAVRMFDIAGRMALIENTIDAFA